MSSKSCMTGVPKSALSQEFSLILTALKQTLRVSGTEIILDIFLEKRMIG